VNAERMRDRLDLAGAVEPGLERAEVRADVGQPRSRERERRQRPFRLCPASAGTFRGPITPLRVPTARSIAPRRPGPAGSATKAQTTPSRAAATTFGTRRFSVDDHSTNVFWLALLSMGESWHHNHHAFPRSAAHGLRWWEFDVTAYVIRALRATGLAWNVVEIPPERQRALQV
jgi:hypothetical protein